MEEFGWPPGIVGGVEVKGAAAAAGFFKGATYTDKVLIQATEKGFHGFPQSADGFAAAYGSVTSRAGADGAVYQSLTVRGEYLNRTGTFEYIKDSAGKINRRYFSPD